MAEVFIYALKCPDTQAIRYVGKTSHALETRLSQHLATKDQSHRARWLADLQAQGKRPLIELLEETDAEQWQERECWWIAELRRQGCDLVNMTLGGEGVTTGNEYPDRKYTVLLEPCFADWAKEQPGGLSEFLRRLLEEAHRKAGGPAPR